MIFKIHLHYWRLAQIVEALLIL